MIHNTIFIFVLSNQEDFFTSLFHFLASTSSSNTFLGQYSSLLEEADGTHLSRTITSISADPSNDEECAAYCHLANSGIYYLDLSGKVLRTRVNWE